MVRRFVPTVIGLALVTTSVSYAEDKPGMGNAPAQAAAAATPSAGAPAPGPGDLVDAEPFTEKTTVEGTIDAKLEGVWLLVAMGEIAKGKFKNFAQLLKITKGEKGPELHLLDVRLPDSVEQSLREANRKTLTAWVPSAETRKILGETWSKLPPAKQKARDEFLYLNIDYLLASADAYGAAFPTRSDMLNKALDGSKLGLTIVEDYRPRPAATSFRGSQVARRHSVYGVKTIDKDVLKGDMVTGFIAMGTGVPIPLDFTGRFEMYRLAPP